MKTTPGTLPSRLLKLTAAAALAAVFVAALPAAAQAASPPPWLAGFDKDVKRWLHDWNVPGASVAIVKDDKVVFARGFGSRELGKPGAVDADTLFAIGSNTKAFTAAAVVMLAQDDKLSLDDRVVERLPWFQLRDPYVTREARIRDLLSHRLGYETWAGDLVAWGSTYGCEEVVRRFRHLEPQPSGFRTYGYNNWPFAAAGLVIAAVDGRSWEAFVTERLLRPLGMARTTVGVPELAKERNVATPYTLVAGTWTPIPHRSIDAYAPAASMYSSANELARWVRVQLADGKLDGRQVLTPEVFQEMRTPHTLLPLNERLKRAYPWTHLRAHGLGLFVRDQRGRLVVDHTGGVDGMFSLVATVPEERLGIVVLTNSETSLMRAIELSVLDRAFGVPARERPDWSGLLLADWKKDPTIGENVDTSMLPPRDSSARAPLPLERYAGRYESTFLGAAVVSLKGGKLEIEMPWHPGLAAELQPWHGDVFAARWKDVAFKVSPVTFVLDATGRPAELRLKVNPFIDPLEHAFKRVEDAAAPSAAAH